MIGTFLRRHASHYNIAEMAIVFGIFAVVGIFPALLAGVALYQIFGLPDWLAASVGCGSALS